jgi:hypothetical protein
MLLLILAVLFVAFVVETILTETENFGWATVTLIALGVVSVVAGHWFHTYSVVDFVKDHGVWTLVYVVGYLVVGVAWSFAKWLSFLIGFRDTFRAEREKFLTVKGLPTGSVLTEELQTEFIKGFGSEFRHGRGRIYDHSGNLVKPEGWIAETFEYRGNALNARPRATKNKTRITAWASFWPFSFVGTLLNDPVRRLFNFLFNWFKALYQQLADYVFRKDLELK